MDRQFITIIQESEMSGAQGGLLGAMRKLTSVNQTGTNKQLLYIVAFIVFLFILLYFFGTRIAARSSTPATDTQSSPAPS